MKWRLKIKQKGDMHIWEKGKVVGQIFRNTQEKNIFIGVCWQPENDRGKTKTNGAIDFKYDPLKAQPGPYPSPSIIFMSVTCGGVRGGRWWAPTCSTQHLRHWLPGDQTGPLAPLCSPPRFPAQVPYRRRLTHFSSLPVPLPGEKTDVVCVCWVGEWVFAVLNKSVSSSVTVKRWRRN